LLDGATGVEWAFYAQEEAVLRRGYLMPNPL
jgi:hypothetical protein